MNAVLKTTPTPILERIEAYMRDNPITREQAEVVKEFDSESANLVRLALGALRKQGKLAHSVEGGRVFYIWSGEQPQRAPDAAPLRQAGTAFVKNEPSLEKVYAALRDGGQAQYSAEQIVDITDLKPGRVKKCLQALILAGKAYAEGQTKARRYSLKPFETRVVAAPRPTPTPTRAPRAEAPVAANEPNREPAQDPPAPKEIVATPQPTPTPFIPPGGPIALHPVSMEDIPRFTAGRPTAAMTADRRIVIVNGGRGTILDQEITTVVIELIRKFDEAGPKEIVK